MRQRILSGLVLGLAAATAQAALHGRLPATPGGSDYQAYYDDALGITWLADANAAQTSGFDTDGRMPWAFAQAWIITLNAAHHLGASNWRLPQITDTGSAGCDFAYSGTDCGYNVAAASGEMVSLFYSLGNTSAYSTFGVPRHCSSTPPNYCLGNAGPFLNLQPSGYWSGTEYVSVGNAEAWSFDFGTGGQQNTGKGTLLFAWAVRAGDIDADQDGVTGQEDNCTQVANPTQLNTDADRYGNHCDGDLNNSGLVTAGDFNLLRGCINLPASTSALCAAADMNGSGLVTAADFNLLRAQVNQAPGPSGLPPCTPGAAGCGWQVGDMRTSYQSQWGNPSSPAGALLTSSFDYVYSASSILQIGIPGAAGFSIIFTSGDALLTFLPQSGPFGPLTSDLANPSTSVSGVFGGEVAALTLNIDFSDAGVLPGAPSPLGDLRICNFAPLPAVNGTTVRAFLATANTLLGGGSASINLGQSTSMASIINTAFADGTPSPFAQDNLVNGPCP